jgi:hypothetical protein
MPEPSESSGQVLVTSPAGNDQPESPTYVELIASTIRRSTWFMGHFGTEAGHSVAPLGRLDIATGEVGKEVDLLPDLGVALTGGTGNVGVVQITTSFPFVIEKGVRLSCRVRTPSSVAQTFNLDIRLIK